MKKNQDISDVYAGNTREITVALTGDITDINTAQAVQFVVRNRYKEENLIEKDLDDGITILTATSVKVTLSKTDTALLDAGIYEHRVIITDSDGKVCTAATGKLTVLE